MQQGTRRVSSLSATSQSYSYSVCVVIQTPRYALNARSSQLTDSQVFTVHCTVESPSKGTESRVGVSDGCGASETVHVGRDMPDR
jgi:hypothetical protein